jgi:hypothetical protein
VLDVLETDGIKSNDFDSGEGNDFVRVGKGKDISRLGRYLGNNPFYRDKELKLEQTSLLRDKVFTSLSSIMKSEQSLAEGYEKILAERATNSTAQAIVSKL